MSDDLPKIGFNPVVELNAQNAEIDNAKIAEFFRIYEEEANTVVQRIVERAQNLGLSMEEIATLLTNINDLLGFSMENLRLLDVKEDEV